MKWISLLSLLMGTHALANIVNAPDNFQTSHGKAIFIDIEKVSTKITYDFEAETASAQSTINFTTTEEGMPIFDLVPTISTAKINGKKIEIAKVNAPDDATSYKLIKSSLKAGSHTLYIENTFTANVKFKKGWLFSKDYVRSAFWMSDLNDRRYIEQYIPTNIEFDQYKQDLEIEIVGAKTEHQVYTNGSLQNLKKNHFKIDFPNYFTASSFYFHMMEKDHFKSTNFNFTSTNGKTIPVAIYTASASQLSSLKELTIKTLKELESKLGPWSHPSLTIYMAGMGGMEHSGATMTSKSALGHELIHSYFARGVMPIDGNSGWLDEAIASWRDKGYKAVATPNFSSTRMSAHSQYKRSTDRKAYTQGANFMAFLNHELKDIGGLTTFLSKMYMKYSHKGINTHIFKKELDLFSGRDFSAEFNQYIFGMSNVNSPKADHKHAENPYHPALTKKQLLDLL